MVDGMGPCGTEGTFVRSSEETVRVLRKNAGTLLTILSAVVADPLYKWSVSPVEGMRRQKMGSDDAATDNMDIPVDGDQNSKVQGGEISDDKNEMGQKALAKINDKLQGYEESTSGEQQGVEGQVQLLINSARDADNLCLMYPGWSSFV
jgi:ataxia telangiectasia mutated family protein